MSCYTKLFETGQGARTYVIHVNSLGEAVMYEPTADGKAQDFASGPLHELLAVPLIKSGLPYCIASLPILSGGRRIDDNPWGWFTESFPGGWAETCEILNRGKGAKSIRVRAQYLIYRQRDIPIHRFVKWQYRSGNGEVYTPTERAAAWDAKNVKIPDPDPTPATGE